MKIIWVLVNCSTTREADKIGKESLRQRLTSCFDIFPRLVTRYFWPPKSGRIETTKGCLLVMETIPKHFKKLDKLTRKIHSDRLPFIGTIEISHIHKDYINWLRGELVV